MLKTMQKVLHFLYSETAPIPPKATMLSRPKDLPVFGETTSKTGGLSGSRSETSTPLSKVWGFTGQWFPLSFQSLGFRWWWEVSQILFHCVFRQSFSKRQWETNAHRFFLGEVQGICLVSHFRLLFWKGKCHTIIKEGVSNETYWLLF